MDMTGGGADYSFECIGNVNTMPLEDINKAFDLMHSGESIRSVVLY